VKKGTETVFGYYRCMIKLLLGVSSIGKNLVLLQVL
jgi:hypothetical protein